MAQEEPVEPAETVIAPRKGDPNSTEWLKPSGSPGAQPGGEAANPPAQPTLVERVMELLQHSGIKLQLSSQSPFRIALQQLGQHGEGREFYASHYSVHGTVGQGGIGRVFLAYDQHLGREVAIKELLPCSDPEDLRTRLGRFVREIKVTGQLEHPGIVPIYEVGLKEDGTLYYVMKYVRGKTMHDAVDDADGLAHSQALAKRLALLSPLIDVCEAMSYAHSRGIVHRDLKPANIILGSFGETIILDWGLAKVQGDTHDDGTGSSRKTALRSTSLTSGITLEGEILGTPAFMAPEQIDNTFGLVNARTDVYALGSILYFILTGQLPYDGDPLVIISAVSDRRRASPSPGQRLPSLAPELVAICEKAMRKDQAERFADAGEMAEQLRAYRDGRIVSAYNYTWGELFRRFIARHKVWFAAGSIAVIALLAGTGLAVHWAVRAEAAREQAVTAQAEAERARGAAERAVEEVTDLANNLERMSAQTAKSLEDNLARLTREMERVAATMGSLDLKDAAASRPHLAALLKRFPNCDSFWAIVTPGILASVAPSQFESAIGADVTHQEHIKWVFEHRQPVFSRVFELVEEKGRFAVTVQVPVFRDGRMTGTIAAVLRPERVVPQLIPEELRKHQAARLWCVQEDGYVLFANDDPRQVGSYLFTDQTCTKHPELARFAERMRKEPAGIGYLRCASSTRTRVIHRVAAWQTLGPAESNRWKIVVIEPYEVAQ